MGGAVSSGQDNDELIDNLKEAEYIKTDEVERVFRIVDRAHYYLEECRENAYKDLAWKSGTLHLSAPCIYSEVMEALELKEGLSFLNLGSGTGYLNTMVGLMLGPYGVNHGIELHSDNVQYAIEKLESFIKTSKRFDDIELCEPKFVVGNCLNLAPENRLYDRVYCGAACPPELKDTIQNLIKINGILVIPVGDQLLKIKRISEKDFVSDNVLPVSFASLVQPTHAQSSESSILLPEASPLSLQLICRVVIRNAIRLTFDFNLPESTGNKRKSLRQTRFFNHESGRYPLNILPTARGLMIMGAFNHSDDDDDDDDEDDDEEYTHSDDDLLDQQLQHHATEIRMARERAKQAILDVDSDISETEEADSIQKDNSQSNDINGNKDDLIILSNEPVDIPESMDSENGNAGDNGNGKKINAKEKPGVSGTKVQVGKGKSVVERSTRAKRFSYHNPYERITDRILNIMGSEKDDPSPLAGVKSKAPVPPCKRSTSLSSDDDVVAPKLGTNSPAILVTASTSSTSSPQAITTSYSTSADTSETSGFGSLGDDTLHVGSQLSGLGSFKDDIETMSTDVASSSSVGGNGNKHTTWPRSSKEEHTLENDKASNDEYDSLDAGWMDIDDDDSDGSEKKPSSSCKEKEVNAECHASTAPDFTLYLKEKVNTLPIPTKLKEFLLYYR